MRHADECGANYKKGLTKEKMALLDKIINEHPELKKEIEELQRDARACLKEFLKKKNNGEL